MPWGAKEMSNDTGFRAKGYSSGNRAYGLV